MSTTASPTIETFQEIRTEAAARRYAIFRRRQQQFGLSIDLVREVLPGQPLTRVPRASAHILGVLSLRGEILPVATIDEWLGLIPQPDNPVLPILVLRHGELLVGLRVDSIQSVVTVPPSEVQPHPTTDAGALFKGLWQSADQSPITLLDGDALLGVLRHDTTLNR